MQTLTLTLTLAETQDIVNVLAEKPYHLVEGLIQKIRIQAAGQLTAEQPADDGSSEEVLNDD